jgi:hypothetical protein
MVRKGVRAKDGNDLGNVIAIEGSNITVQGRKILKIPSQFIDLYNGSEVFLTSIRRKHTSTKFKR